MDFGAAMHSEIIFLSLNLPKGVPGNARARLPAHRRANNWAIWQNQVPVA